MTHFKNLNNDEITIFFYQNLLDINFHSSKMDNVIFKTAEEWISHVENKVIGRNERNKQFIDSSWWDEKRRLKNMGDQDFVYDYIKGEWICFDNYDRELYAGNKFYLLFTDYTVKFYEKSSDQKDIAEYPLWIDQSIEV